MSKQKQLGNLAGFIGMRAAHEIMIELTNKEESVRHMEKEIETYDVLIFKLAKGNWNQDDIKEIKKLAIKRCNKKLEEYKDISEKKYERTENAIEDIMYYLKLYADA
ncbi:hypothetical protein HYU06_07035 [Candidatus Woesearchaeota archaeon]|nr:hypothetical protein [Candidatus Woesearchaeota archaeon]